MFKFITHRNLFVNLLFGAALLAIIIFSFFSLLSWFTGHKEYERVPYVRGKGFQEAKAILESKGFTVEIADSIFDINLPRLGVVKQTPESGATVKSGRTIYLTVNRLVAPLVDMPNLVGYSIKSAEIYLTSLGLRVGDTIFKPDYAKNSIISQYYLGKDIAPGTKISVGSSIDLIIGSGLGNEEAEMPDLIGLTYAEAYSLLSSMNIGLGNPILLDSQLKDTARAYVTRQEPPVYFEFEPGQKIRSKVRQGQIVDVWLSINKPNKDSLLLLDQMLIDSLQNP